MVAKQFGIQIELVMPENSTKERIQTMEAYGAKVTLTPTSVGIEGSREYAENIVKEKGLESEFDVTLSKTKELNEAFFYFMESLNITLFKISNILGFAFLIPLLPYIHQISEGKLSIMDIDKIITILLSYGVLTISSSTLKEIMVKLIKRFKG